MDFPDGGADVAVGEACEADVAVGVDAAEVHQPVVVDTEHLVGGFGVVQAGGRTQDAVDHLGVDPVTVHVAHAQLRIGRPANAFLAIVVEPGGRHHVHSVVRPGHVLLPGRTHAVHQAE